MLASSQSPELHSSSSSNPIKYRRPSYSPRQNASSSSPRIASLRKSQVSPSVGVRAKTRDASTQYSPQQNQESAKDSKGHDPGKMAGTENQSAVTSQKDASEVTAQSRHHSESSPPKRSSKDASLSSSNDASESSNPQKRAKSGIPADKILPARYEHCDPNDLVVMLSTMIADLVRINDPNHLTNGRLTRFHSRVAPGISAQEYLKRLAVHLALQPVILLTMCFYMDRLSSFYSEFTVNSLTCHRFLITAATVATKGLSDSFWNNSTYARVGGVKLSELALLELEFLHRVDWRIIPDNNTLVSYYHGLITRTEGYSLAPSRSEKQTNGHETTSTNRTDALSLNSNGSDTQPSSSPATTSSDGAKSALVTVKHANGVTDSSDSSVS